MPANRNALIRYKTLDNCLQNRQRKWTLQDLIDSVSDALYEYEGIDYVSKRTVQGDIQTMRSDKLGYNAPIVVVERKYYTYEDPDYSITNMPLSETDLEHLAETAAFLKQFSGFSHFQELSGMVQKLEDHVYSKTSREAPIIDFEKNENLKGLSHLDFLYQAIKKKQVLALKYKSFKARTSSLINLHGYLLKEFNNRWFLVGINEIGKKIMTLALDRIVNVKLAKDIRFLENKTFDPAIFYDHVVGVTVPNSKLETIRIFIDKYNAPYVITKPLHHSQQVIETTHKGTIIEVKVIINFEFERLLLGFGATMEVLSPPRFRRRMKTFHKKAFENYDNKSSDGQ